MATAAYTIKINAGVYIVTVFLPSPLSRDGDQDSNQHILQKNLFLTFLQNLSLIDFQGIETFSRLFTSCLFGFSRGDV